jgi:hypothetical protein
LPHIQGNFIFLGSLFSWWQHRDDRSFSTKKYLYDISNQIVYISSGYITKAVKERKNIFISWQYVYLQHRSA